MGISVSATAAVVVTMNAQIATLTQELHVHFEKHPDAEVVRSLPGLATILSARVLGEFGDEPNRYATAKCRKNYASTSPITRASGTKRVVLAATPAICVWLTPFTSGRSHRSPPHPAPERSMTTGGRPVTPTTPPYATSAIALSASSTVASSITASTTKTLPGVTVPR
jgi:hypothetical protein